MDDSPQDVYAKCLPNDRGYPLRFPEPSSTLPSSHRQDGLQIGDVGYVTQQGAIQRSFQCILWAKPRSSSTSRPKGRLPRIHSVLRRARDTGLEVCRSVDETTVGLHLKINARLERNFGLGFIPNGVNRLCVE
ncbi:hypothetical protein HD554DRAFT_1451795 [Boletus coccyginus]|nr:hypothetical protein HD554DRAFT_1451795 [Boletus coccyginus]